MHNYHFKKIFYYLILSKWTILYKKYIDNYYEYLKMHYSVNNKFPFCYYYYLFFQAYIYLRTLSISNSNLYIYGK